MSEQKEIWQVMIGEEVHEADLETLKQWVIDGQVQSSDFVRKGNLRWIEAGRAPVLRRVFLGEEAPQPVPVQQSIPTTQEPFVSYLPSSLNQTTDYTDGAPSLSETYNPEYSFASVHETERKITGLYCQNHPGLAPTYVCRSCHAAFCKDCTKFTSNIAVCASCGGLCQKYEEIRRRIDQMNYQQASFGFSDLIRSLTYPFRDPIALIASALFYSILMIAGTGLRTGVVTRVVAHAIIFGCMSQVIRQVAVGRFNRSFLPDFGAFSWYDDAIVPLRASFGVTLISWGPLIFLILALLFGLFKFGGPSLSYSEQAEQRMIEDREEFAKDYEAFINGNDPEREKAFAEKVEGLSPASQMSESHKRHQEEAIEASVSEVDPVLSSTVKTLLAAAIPIMLLLALAFLWGMFYYPVALAVAGYTQDFWSVINPVVGISTIRSMGWIYVKAFFMYLAISIIGGILSFMVAIITAPFHMPMIGNPVANFINGMITFYTSLAIAFLLGLSLFKCADKLDIPID